MKTTVGFLIPYEDFITIGQQLMVDGKELWIETKSLNGPFQQTWFKNTLVGKKKDDADKLNRGYYRQHFQDMRLNDKFVNTENRNKIFDFGDVDFKWSTNAEYNWYFHDFKKKTGSNPPVKADITKAEKWLCAKPDVNEEYLITGVRYKLKIKVL